MALAVAALAGVFLLQGLRLSLSEFCWSFPVRPYLITSSCSVEKLCRCDHNFTADCSSNFGSLSYVPNFTDFTVGVFNFSSNRLTNISQAGFFRNVSKAWLIDLYNNGLEYIHPQAFEGVISLRTLLLGGNNLGYKELTPVFAIPTLQNLEFLCANLGPVPANIFQNVSMKTLKYLKLGFNDIQSLDLSCLQPLPILTNFTFWSSKLYNLTTARLENLRHLDFRQNRLFDFPKTCDDTSPSMSLFPKLTSLGLDFNMIEAITGPVCLPNLKSLSIQFNRISIFESNTFNTQKFPSLLELRATQMEIKVKQIKPFAFNNSVLRHIQFARNEVDMATPTVVDVQAFEGCSRLTYLYWDYNNFSFADDARFRVLFEPLEGSLRVLFVGYSQIKFITPDMFSKLKLLKELFLYGNNINFIPDGAFDQLKCLKVLSMNKNRLSVISQDTFGNKTRKRLETIDLSDNPFTCSCDLRWFQEWYTSSPGQFGDYNSGGYLCSNVFNTSLSSFYISEQVCLMGHDAAAFTVATIVILLLFLTLFAFLFRYRWRLRLLMYEAFHHRETRNRQRHNFTYDVFVGYAVEDRMWVMHELLPVLEGQWNLRVCVHERDFVPGMHIVDNIADCVRDSSKILMVFSPDYARSEWCQFELRYSQCCVMDREEVLVLVLLHDVESREMSSAMFAVLQTTTYIQWAESADAQASFWGRLGVAFNELIRERSLM